MTAKKLTAKQEMFCREYLIDLNGTQAAVRAGYSVNAANEIAAENLAKPSIQKYLALLKEKRQEATKITAEWVLKEAEECYHALKKQNAHKDALKALDLIGRHTVIKAFDKQNVQDNKIDVHIKVNNVDKPVKTIDNDSFSFAISQKPQDNS